MGDHSMFKRLWAALAAILLGFAIAILGNLTWSVLLGLNLATAPGTPWSAAAMLCVLALAWAYIGGWGPPKSSKALRNRLLPQARLSIPTWVFGLCASLGVLTAFLCALLVAYRLLPIPVAPLPEMAQSAPILALVYFGAASLVAGMAEEAGFRGYMQAGLDQAFGPTASTVLVAVTFALLHAANPEFLYLIPLYFGVSVALSMIVRMSKSIWPGVVAHFAADFASYILLLLMGAESLTARAALDAPDQALLLVACVGAIGLLCAVAGFVGLKARGRAESA